MQEKNKNERKLAIISMSGGLDSATLVAQALYDGFDVFIINFNYAQKNSVEQIAADNLFDYFKNKYISNGQIIGRQKINLLPLMSVFLNTWKNMRDSGKIQKESGHQFYMPSRNLLFAVISEVIGEIIALNQGYEEVHIGLGIHKHTEEAYGKERPQYWDITPQFAKKLQELFELNDIKKIKIYTPFVDKTKADVVKRALELNVPYKMTWTCYNPSIKEGVAIPCLNCEACKERQLAGEKIGIHDINVYQIILEGEKND